MRKQTKLMDDIGERQNDLKLALLGKDNVEFSDYSSNNS